MTPPDPYAELKDRQRRMREPFEVRPATAVDVPALVTLVNSAYRGDSSRAGWTTEADLLDGIRIDEERLHAIVGSPDMNVVLVHERNAAILASVHLERTGAGCYLGMLTTAPVRQGQGLGRQMIAAAEDWARERWRAREMHMTVLVQRAELRARVPPAVRQLAEFFQFQRIGVGVIH